MILLLGPKPFQKLVVGGGWWWWWWSKGILEFALVHTLDLGLEALAKLNNMNINRWIWTHEDTQMKIKKWIWTDDDKCFVIYCSTDNCSPTHLFIHIITLPILAVMTCFTLFHILPSLVNTYILSNNCRIFTHKIWVWNDVEENEKCLIVKLNLILVEIHNNNKLE